MLQFISTPGKTFSPKALRERLFAPVDIASLAAFRVFFGAVLLWEVWRFFDYGWIGAHYVDHPFHFTYFGFGWVRPWPGIGMYVHFAAMGVLAVCVLLGLWYRVASAGLFLSVGYWFLLDEARYLNHIYLVTLLTFLMALLPAHRMASVDVLRGRVRSWRVMPAWGLWLLRAQIGLVYFYAGIAKLSADWLQGEPIRQWLAARVDYALIGPWLATEAAVWGFAYGGILFDLLVVPLLLWPRTRGWAFAGCVLFHGTNMVLFDIGIFPVTMVAATLLFFPSDWPRHLWRGFQRHDGMAPLSTSRALPSPLERRWVEGFVAVYLGVQVLLPLRHFVYPGEVHWTEEGHRFAWHMKLRSKRAEVAFLATDPRSGRTWNVDTRPYLSERQRAQVGRWPDMTLQLAHFLARELEADGHAGVEIRAIARASLNGRPPQLLLDPRVDLARTPRTLWPARWILPLETPLRPGSAEGR